LSECAEALAPIIRSSRTAAGRQRSGDIRVWAKDHGSAVSARGRIPVSVIEQYQAAAATLSQAEPHPAASACISPSDHRA